MRKPRPVFYQVLLSIVRDAASPTGHRPQLEILKRWHKGPRRVGIITGAGLGLCGGQFGVTEHAPTPIILDFLADHPECVQGLTAKDVLAAVEAVRQRGHWFVSHESLV